MKKVSMKKVSPLIAGVLTLCVLTGAAQAQPEPTATQADAGASVALFAVKALGSYAANQNAANGFGQFLMKLGFGDANTAALEKIQATLNEINSKLTILENKVDLIKASVEKSRCESIQISLGEVASSIKVAWRDFGHAVHDAQGASVDAQRALGARLRADIEKHLNAARDVVRIHDAVAGTAGSPSMINNCGVAVQEGGGDLVSSSLRDKMDSMVDYWQVLEAEAAVLNIGLEVDNGHAFAAKEAQSEVENNLTAESSLLKPSLGDKVVDARTHLTWQRTFHNAFSLSNVPARLKLKREGWRLPTPDEVLGLLKKCCESLNVISWLREKTPFEVPERPRSTVGGILTDKAGRTNVDVVGLYGTKPLTIIAAQRSDCYATFVRIESQQEWQRYLYSS